MSFKVISKTVLPEWIEQLCAGYRVVGPRQVGNHHIFDDIHSADEIDLGYPTTILPPKKYLLPPYEELIDFSTDGSPAMVRLDKQPTIILGIHTCDMHAVTLLDQIFGQRFPDQHYQARRENLTLVSIECLEPCSAHAFCKSMGTLSVPDNFDLHLTDLGEDYALEIGSDKGMALMQGFVRQGSAAIREASQEDTGRANLVMSEKWSRFPYRLEFDVSELASLLSISYHSTMWDELGERCLACGMCTAVCPTCHCFNMTDELDLTLSTGRRCRLWDSCQLAQFATVAGGHNFRESRAARLRHRFLHKGKYQTESYGQVGCVGCGRCAQTCLVHIDPVDTFNSLYRKRVAAMPKVVPLKQKKVA